MVPISEYDGEPSSWSVSVTHPQLVQTFPRAYTSYTVSTSQSSDSATLVQRRYRDFVTLRSSLRDLHPGLILPPLPPKITIGNLNDDVVVARQRALERFLRRLVHHHQLCKDRVIGMFLTEQEFTVNTSH